MEPIWTGSIVTDDLAVTFKDIQLWSPSTLIEDRIGHDAKLHFLSLVHVPSIPLYLAAGPSLDVSTDDESTAAWLSQSLLGEARRTSEEGASSEPWWTSLGKQSEQGILLKVEEEGATDGVYNHITELLLYAAEKTDGSSLPTPPTSSSAGEELPHDVASGPREVKVYALPLSSRVIGRAQNAMHVVTPPPEDVFNPTPACFLADDWRQQEEIQKTHQKRQSLSSLFDDATQKRRKLKGRGGESVAQAMASIDRPITQNGAKATERHESREPSSLSTKANAARRSLSRASTMPSVSITDYTRPVSRSGALANGKRSSLHRVESAISPRDSPTLSDTDDSIGNQNKAALTKIVMAGMRLYGLQQKRKTGKGAANLGSSAINASMGETSAEKDSDDEYKLVYHQTFKAATFAFRRHFSSQVIPLETMRDVVDRFLDLFCSDPTAIGVFNAGDQPAFGTQGSEGSGAFDLPSGTASSPRVPKTCSTPMVKRHVTTNQKITNET